MYFSYQMSNPITEIISDLHTYGEFNLNNTLQTTKARSLTVSVPGEDDIVFISSFLYNGQVYLCSGHGVYFYDAASDTIQCHVKADEIECIYWHAVIMKNTQDLYWIALRNDGSVLIIQHDNVMNYRLIDATGTGINMSDVHKEYIISNRVYRKIPCHGDSESSTLFYTPIASNEILVIYISNLTEDLPRLR